MKIDYLSGQAEVVFTHYAKGGHTCIQLKKDDGEIVEATQWAEVEDGQIVVRDLRFLVTLNDAGLANMLDTWKDGGYLCALTKKGKGLETATHGQYL